MDKVRTTHGLHATGRIFEERAARCPKARGQSELFSGSDCHNFSRCVKAKCLPGNKRDYLIVEPVPGFCAHTPLGSREKICVGSVRSSAWISAATESGRLPDSVSTS